MFDIKRRNVAGRKINIQKVVALLLFVSLLPTILTTGSVQFWLVLKIGWFWFVLITSIAVIICIKRWRYKLIFGLLIPVFLGCMYHQQGLVEGNVESIDQGNKVIAYRKATLGETNYFGTVYEKKFFGTILVKQYAFKFINYDRNDQYYTVNWVYAEAKANRFWTNKYKTVLNYEIVMQLEKVYNDSVSHYVSGVRAAGDNIDYVN